MRDGVTSPARPAWIPAFAGMTERGAGMTEGRGNDGYVALGVRSAIPVAGPT